MLALAGHPLGVRCRVLEPSADAPASPVAEHVHGAFDDPEVLRRFVDGLAVATYEIEHVPPQALEMVAGHVPIRPGASVLAVTADRLTEKRGVRELGIGTAPFAVVDEEADVLTAADELGLPLVLKTRTEGYDGRGQVIVRAREEAADAFARLGGRNLIAEGWVAFDRELAITVVRSASDEVRTYDVVENHHDEGILRWTLAPAPDLDEEMQAKAFDIGRRLAEGLDYQGVMTAELFQVGRELLVNEIAPRVHNSAHWTIDGAVTSQFENHIRAILDLPLGPCTTRESWVQFNILGEVPELRGVLEHPDVHVHLYDKAPRPRRKLGHVTCRADDPRNDRSRLQTLLNIP